MTLSATRGTRSWEFSAIPLVLVLLGVLAVIMYAFSQGLWVWLTVGVVLLAGLVAPALVLLSRPQHPAARADPSRPDGAPPPLDDGVRRVLVIADDACAPRDLGAALADHGAGGSTTVFVIAPALGSRTARWTGDELAYQDAAKHLEATLQALAGLGIEADGHVGSHDPLQAAEDGLREFPADEIVLLVHPAGTTNWLEDGVVAAARGRYPLPVTELLVE